MRYNNSFVASTSDFWQEGCRNINYAGSVGNFMGPTYTFRNGLTLAVSDCTMEEMKREGRTTDLLKNSTPVIRKVSAIVDFKAWYEEKTGAKIGVWLGESHAQVGIKADHIGSHTVDGASNAGSSVRNLQWNTSNSRS